MNEIESLVQRAEKYLHSAEPLLNNDDFESSVSRAYYAMFYVVEALLLNRGLSFSSHSGVITLFGEHFIKTGIFPREMGRELNRAYQKRQLSDYEYNLVITKAEADQLLAASIAFVEQVKTYFSVGNRL